MKQLFTMALFAGLAPATFAQLTLTSGEMLPFNSSFTQLLAEDPAVVDTSIQGANAVWNFANLQPAASGSLTVNIVNPANTPYGSSFPAANYAYHEMPAGAYRYFTLSNSKMERVGSYSGGTLKTYSDPQIEYVFPLALGSSSYDTWANSGSSFGGTYSLRCIGTGTLTIPSGTYEALMVRVITEEGPFTILSYFWYDADNGSILLQYLEGDGFITSTFARYVTQVTLDTKESAIFQNLAYNNPVEGQLNLRFDNPGNQAFTYRLYDINGRTVGNGKLPNAAQVYLSEDMGALSAGLYYLTLSNADHSVSETIKLIKR